MDPPRLQSWRFLVGLFTTAQLMEFMAWGHLQAFTPLYLREVLGVPDADIARWTGFLASSSLAVAVPLSPFWGVLADRYSHKAVILRSQYIGALGFAIVALASDVHHMLAARLLLGLTFGNIAVVLATVSLATPDRRVSTAMGIVQMAFPLAMSLGPLVGSFLIKLVGMRGMFAIDAASVLLAALLITLLFKDPPRRASTGGITSQLKAVFRQVVAVGSIRWNFLAWFFAWGASGAADPFVPLLIAHVYHGDDLPLAIGGLLAVYGVVIGLSTPLAGRLADSFPASRLLLVTLPLLASIMVGMSTMPDVSVLAALMIGRAVPQAATGPLLYAHLVRHMPKEHRAGVLALTPLPRNAAMLIAPLLASLVSGLGLQAVFYLAAGFFVLTFAAVVLMSRKS